MSDIDRAKSNGGGRPKLAKTVLDLILQEGDPARLLELYYWSQEPGLLDCIRAIIAMPEDARATLQAFLSDAGAGETVSASIDPSGALKLQSVETDKCEKAGDGQPHHLQS